MAESISCWDWKPWLWQGRLWTFSCPEWKVRETFDSEDMFSRKPLKAKWLNVVLGRCQREDKLSILDLGPSVEQRQILMDELPANTSESWCLRIFLFACFSDECRILSWPLVYCVPAISVCQLPKPGRSLVICAVFLAPLSPLFLF